MDSTLLLFICIALASVSVLCITLAFVAVKAGKNLGKMTETLEQVGNNIEEIKEKTIPVLDQTSSILTLTEGTIEKLDRDLDRFSKGAELFESIAKEVKQLQTMVIDKVRAPITEISSLFSGAVKGFTEFTKTLLDK